MSYIPFFEKRVLTLGSDEINVGPGVINLRTATHYDFEGKATKITDSEALARHHVVRSQDSYLNPETVAEPEIPAVRDVELSDGKKTWTLSLPPGVTAIVGQSTSGKSTLLSRLIVPSELIIWGEPRSISCWTAEEAGLSLLKRLSTSDVVGLDSISTALYAGGDKLEKGLSADSLITLANLDSLFRSLNKSLVVTFAPMMLQDDALEQLVKSIVNQKVSMGVYLPAPGTIVYSDRTQSSREWRTRHWSAKSTPVSEKKEDRMPEDELESGLFGSTAGTLWPYSKLRRAAEKIQASYDSPVNVANLKSKGDK